MIPMRVMGFALDAETEAPVLVLRQEGGEAVLPVWIGQAEALAIATLARGEDSPRPLPHDLLLRAVTALSGRVTGFSITELRDGLFIGALDILCEGTGQLVSLDCRPSDGIAVALRAHVPIMVDETVLAAAAVGRRRNERPGDFWETPALRNTPWPDLPAKRDNAAEEPGQADLLQGLEPVSKRVM